MVAGQLGGRRPAGDRPVGRGGVGPRVTGHADPVVGVRGRGGEGVAPHHVLDLLAGRVGGDLGEGVVEVGTRAGGAVAAVRVVLEHRPYPVRRRGRPVDPVPGHECLQAARAAVGGGEDQVPGRAVDHRGGAVVRLQVVALVEQHADRRTPVGVGRRDGAGGHGLAVDRRGGTAGRLGRRSALHRRPGHPRGGPVLAQLGVVRLDAIRSIPPC